MSNSEILEMVLNSLPYTNQISDIDFSGKNEIRFSWRGARFRVNETLHVEEVKGVIFAGSNSALLFQSLLEKTRLIKAIK